MTRVPEEVTQTMLYVEVGFDGSCPQSLEGVRQEGDTEFRIFPSWRSEPGRSEECLGRTTRLGFRVRNPGSGPVHGTFHLDWQYNDAPPDAPRTFAGCDEYMRFRDFCVVQSPGSSDWRCVMASVEESVATVRLALEPGATEIHWHPPYNYAQGEAFIEGVRGRPWTAVERLGQTEEGRNLWLVRISDGAAHARRAFLIRARVHPYESASSYAMEGMVRWLLSEDAWAAAARRDYQFFLLPMANPDGVHNGMGRLTAPRGVDLELAAPILSQTQATLMAAVEQIRPAYFVDLHNWQTRFHDGLLWMEPERRARFLYYMPSLAHHGKRWSVRDAVPIEGPPPAQESLGPYCRRVFGAGVTAFEFPWFGRTPEDVRWIGERALWALLMADARWERAVSGLSYPPGVPEPEV